ncbi:hypothetical protein DVH05_019784 [Phytophthora capsici]|nr:hypothetical protein DVH05_019784 [Phytophthora capsici]
MKILELKDLRAVSMFFGIHIHRDSDLGYTVDQEHAIIVMLTSNGLQQANRLRVAMGVNDPDTDDCDYFRLLHKMG